MSGGGGGGVNPAQLGGVAAQQAATAQSKYVWWGMVLGALYFFGPGESIFSYAALGVVFMLAMLYVQQDGMLYACSHPAIPKTAGGNPQGMRHPGERGMPYRELVIPTADGCHLHGWLMPVPGGRSRQAPTIIYFHGNAGNLGMRLPLYEELFFRLGMNVVAFDYRGYGRSTGKPNEAGLRLDAEAVVNFVRTRLQGEVDVTKLLLFGRSLGGSVATWYAGKSTGASGGGIKGLIIENTFMSIGDLAVKLFALLKVFRPLLPLLLKSKWEAKEHIRGVQVPVMLLSAQLDALVPPAHMNTLFENAPDNALTRIHRFFMGGHNDTPLRQPDKYYAAFKTFLADLGYPTTPMLKSSVAGGKLPSSGGGGVGGGGDAEHRVVSDDKAHSAQDGEGARRRGAAGATAVQTDID
jgi:fermentation-respiration switch protein FrsA (DUF1100 family)